MRFPQTSKTAQEKDIWITIIAIIFLDIRTASFNRADTWELFPNKAQSPSSSERIGSFIRILIAVIIDTIL